MMAYNCGLLNTNVSPEHELNTRWLGEKTLGIEVTDPVLAKYCGLGNIDPQHTPPMKETAAIIESLTCPLPPDDANLVTIRVDKDALGAQAILALRADGEEAEINHELVEWIAAVDNFGFKGARTRFPRLHDRAARSRTMIAMDILVHHPTGLWSLAAKVSLIADMLVDKISQKEIDKILAEQRPFKPKVDFSKLVEVYGTGDCKVAFISINGSYGEARSWGGNRYPVTVVQDTTTHRFTVIRQEGCFDRLGFEQAINQLEADGRGIALKQVNEWGFGWGGNKNIISSPQARGRVTVLEKAPVLKTVYAHLESGIVT